MTGAKNVSMLDIKLDTLLTVAEEKNFTKAADKLSLTQPAVSHHMSLIEDELGIEIFLRGKGEFRPTAEGEIVLRYAKRLKAIYNKMISELEDSEKCMTKIRIGITHTAESNLITEALAKRSPRLPASVNINNCGTDGVYLRFEYFIICYRLFILAAIKTVCKNTNCLFFIFLPLYPYIFAES